MKKVIRNKLKGFLGDFLSAVATEIILFLLLALSIFLLGLLTGNVFIASNALFITIALYLCVVILIGGIFS